MPRLLGALGAILLIGTSLAAQKLPRISIAPSHARVYQDKPDGSTGQWQRVDVRVETDGLLVGRDLRIRFEDITAAVYDRRKGGFRGVLRPPEVRHVLTVRYTVGDVRRFVVIELGKKIAELTVNRLESIGGVTAERLAS